MNHTLQGIANLNKGFVCIFKRYIFVIFKQIKQEDTQTKANSSILQQPFRHCQELNTNAREVPIISILLTEGSM